jgi:predicted transcriptional regulator
MARNRVEEWSENPKTETLVVRVEPALKRDIERLAQKAGRPMATVARMLLREAVSRKVGKGKAS